MATKQNNGGWIRTEDQLPPEGKEVETISANGLYNVLKIKGKLWFFPDMSMYVYYVPVCWRLIEK